MTPGICFKHAAHTLTGGAGDTELPSRSGAGTLQRERGSLRRPGSRVQGVGTGTGGVPGQGRGPEEGPREDDGTAAEAGGGAGGAAGQTFPAEEQQPQPGGSAQGAGGQVPAAIGSLIGLLFHNGNHSPLLWPRLYSCGGSWGSQAVAQRVFIPSTFTTLHALSAGNRRQILPW